MNVVQDVITQYLPSKQKTTPSGWTSFNAPCCHHNGHATDKRQRGGIIKGSDGSVSYHCFNCGYKTGWQPGRNLSYKLRRFLQWLNVDDDIINKLALEVMRENEGVEVKQLNVNLPSFTAVQLPPNSLKVQNVTDYNNKYYVSILEYMQQRHLNTDDHDFYWSSDLGYRDRLVIPFYYKNELVGWTGRTISPNQKVKYLSEQQPGYCFNLDAQTDNKLFAIVCEGVVDAIHVDGVALMGSEVSDQQAMMINQLNKQIIVVPDRDKKGRELIPYAIEQGWSVSMPNWSKDIKDISDAVDKYGKVYTLYSIVTQAESYAVKIKLQEKKWFG